ncbi:zinc finger protein ZPR1 [Aplysia californica]|uniref:Zinc finger protein ZPR1 n=1 Tax=Aplysia californica TaxID=6500 RepID=A0ABM1W2D4_APLCA|nr:zinc finger protein ZPR1 [Aplysia californica]XP_035828827.1 zinc finger protein ZPR1 [Aplysia californica]
MSEGEERVSSSDTLDKPLFRDITGEDYDPEITELESLCINCEEQGITRLFLTRIPFFREVIVASFSCDHCGYRNAELQPGGRIQDRGVSFKLNIQTVEDLNRQVVQTAHATVKIPSIEFEIPPSKSALTTIEGVIDRAVEGLEQDQVLRRIQYPDVAAQIDAFIEKLKGLKAVQQPFHFVIDDPSGNSFVENPLAPNRDLQLVVAHYARTKQQDEALGLSEEEEESTSEAGGATVGQDDGEGLNTQNEILQFRTNCPECGAPCDTNMKVVNIPYFKEVVIMATNCDMCGHRDNEVKSSGGIEPKGRRMELAVLTAEDLARDVLKSETASVLIPELEFEMEMGTLGGKFTTVEGLLEDVKAQLKATNPFFHGDSSQPQVNNKLSAFCDKLDDIIKGERKDCHFVLDDPAGNSFIQSLHAPEPDPQIVETYYERTFDQNEDLGLNDMKTENYEET